MQKDLNVNLLLDIYGGLLTPKQKETLELYYADDLSLSEISEGCGISRQGVFRSIKNAEKKLREFEECVGAAQNCILIKNRIARIEQKLLLSGFIDPEITHWLNDIKECL